jgi:FkbM family methyltransferase
VNISTILSLLSDRRAIQAIATWSKFSVTSYQMVSALVKQDIAPQCIIDVGANVGQFSIACSQLLNHPQIHAFEPLPDCVHQLKTNTAKLSNIHIHPIALGDVAGQVEFRVNAHSHSSSILPMHSLHLEAFPTAQETKLLSVDVKTLDQVFQSVQLPRPLMLKVDAQGYESNVLRGGAELLHQVDWVLLETSFKPLYVGELLFNDICQLMQSFGFQFSRPVGWLNDPRNGEVLQMDALFTQPTPAAHPPQPADESRANMIPSPAAHRPQMNRGLT